jgi:hypothetical protein
VKTDCFPAEYCSVSSCSATSGVCIKKPTTEVLLLDPVCGCDHVTYYNGEVAAAHGMNVASRGVCTLPSCTKGTCAGDAHCNLDVGTKNLCANAPVGTCWMVPKGCPVGTAGPHLKECGSGSCTTYCQAIVDEVPFYSQGSGCP